MKRFTFLAIACLFAITTMASWDGTSATIWTNGKGTEAEPYLIENENQLAYLAQQVNSGTNYSGVYFKQTADLDLGGIQNADGTWSTASKQWKIIGNAKNKVFSGCFDGNSHIIKNLYLNDNSKSYYGLFGSINNAIIKNVTIASGFIYSAGCTGGICGYAVNSSIESCVNNTTMYFKSERNGGICGDINNTTINNCVNFGFLSGYNFMGGICGYMEDKNSEIANCLNCAQLFKSHYNCGAICGFNLDALGTITNCFYDNQITDLSGATTTKDYEEKNDIEGSFEGKPTNELIGMTMQSILNSNWSFSTGLYPTINTTSSNEAILLATTPVIIASNENADSVNNNFSLSTSNNISWSSNTDAITIATNGNVTLEKSTSVKILAQKDEFKKIFTFRICNSNLPGIGSKSNPLTISNYNELAEFRDAVNEFGEYKNCANHNGFKGIYIKLTDDIDLKGVNDNGNWTGPVWVPIGSHSSFKGYFDGGNHKITNSNANLPALPRVGCLFSLASYGKIENVIIESGFASATQNVGGLCGAITCEYISNCSANCTITASKNYGGGLIGNDKGYSTIENCTNYGKVSVAQVAGGIVSQNDAGGKIIYCENYGTITASSQKSGGICGVNNLNVSIENCSNYGNINSDKIVGGIIGQSVNNETCISCVNYGNLNATSEYVGGISGESHYGTTTNCINYAKIKLSSSNSAGGITGFAGNSTITNCINNDSILCNATIGGIIGNASGNCLITKCINNGYTQGANNVGGICGVASNTNIVSNSFNAGFIKATSNYVGGICGSVSSGSRCDSCINIGIINGNSSVGAIAGSNSGSINKCYSDKQMFNSITISNKGTTECETLCTNELIGNKLSEKLGTDNWSYNDNMYPIPSGLENSTMAMVSALPVILYSNDDNTTFDIYDNVTKNFKVGISNNAKWVCNNNTVAIDGTNAYIQPSTEKDTVAKLTVKILKYSKIIPLTIKKASGILPVIKWDDNLEPITYGDTITADMLNATVENDIDGSFVYNVGVGDTLEVGQHKLTATFIPEDSTKYLNANASVFLTVNKAETTIDWNTPEPITYGDTLSATQLNATANVDGKFIYIPAIGSTLNAGSQEITVIFMPADDKNYNISEDTINITVNKATPTIVWATPATITYGDTISSYQLNATSAVAGDISYNVAIGDTLNAGDQMLIATLTPTSGNYNTVSDTVYLHISQAKPTIVWPTPSAIVYGTYLNEIQLNAATNAEGSFAYSVASDSLLNCGSNWIVVEFTSENSNYLDTKDSVTINVTPATPIIIWNNPSDIEYGTKLDNTILNAEVDGNIEGEFIYVPSIGQVLETGDSQMLIVTFIPNSNNYSTVKDTVYINVTKASPVISWEPESIVYGTKAEECFNASANVEGSFSYSVSGDSILNAGDNEIIASFTPSSDNYTTVTDTAIVTVTKASPVISWEPESIIYGSKAEECFNASANVEGSFAYSVSGDSILNAGDNEIIASFTPSSGNYTAVTDTAIVSVAKASPVISWEPGTIFYGTKAEECFNASANVEGYFSYSAASDSLLEGGTQWLYVEFTSENNNYSNAKDSISITVKPAKPVIVWNSPNDIEYGAKLDSTILNAEVEGNINGEFIYVPSIGQILEPGNNQKLEVTFIPDNLVNYSIVKDSVYINVLPTTSITWLPTNIVYGTKIGTIYNAETIVEGTFDYSINKDSILNAGKYEITVTFTPTSNEYKPSQKTVNVIVEKADPTITWEPNDITYGTKANATYMAKANIQGSFSYSMSRDSILDAGEHEITATFTPSTKYYYNYNTVKKTVTITVNKAETEISWEGQSIVFGSKAELIQNATANNDGEFVYSISKDTILNVGEYSISTVFTPSTSNYNPADKTISFKVEKAEPEINWATPNSVVYGTKLDIFNATSNVEGNFLYSIEPDSILNAGENEIIAGFMPFSSNFASVSSTVTINVTKATPEIVWMSQDLEYGKKAEECFNATANVEGNFTYSVSDDTILNIGNHELIAWFDPVSSNFASVSSTIIINVCSPAPAITCDSVLTLTYGDTINFKDLNISANTEGDFFYSIASDSILPAGRFELTATFKTIDFKSVSSTITVVVNKAKLFASVSSTTIKFGESIPDFAINYKGFVNGDDENAIDTLPTVTCNANNKVAGTYDIVVSGGYASNYEFVYENAKLTVEKGDLIVDNEAFVNVYPNPTTDAFYVNASDDITEVRIYNAVGKLMMIQPIEGSTRIDISEQPEGTYIVKAGNKVTRIIKK